jgi:CRISPR-associated endonuclease Csn1
MGNYVLGLDLGPTSVGWAAVQLDENNNPTGFALLKDGRSQKPALGSRIFEAGVDKLGEGKNEQTKAKPRQEKRSLRRMNRRKKGRKLRLVALLKDRGLLSVDLEKLYKIDPYELRDRAINEQISLDEISRIILHITQRRGFKSNRKQPEKADERGKIKDGIRELEAQRGNLTVGQFWYKKINESKGKAPQAIRNKGNYSFMARREDYRAELDLIFDCQKKFYPEILDENLMTKISSILFDQIPFELSSNKKRNVIGMCSLLPNQRRCSLASRKAQEFRLLQKISDLRIIEDYKPRELTESERKKLYERLMSTKELTFKQIRSKGVLGVGDNVGFNLEHEGNKKIVGNIIDAAFAEKTIFDKAWHGLTEDNKQKAWDIFLTEFYTEDNTMSCQQLANLYKTEFGIEVQNPEKLEQITVPVSNINYSEKALDKLLPFMREGYDLYNAQRKAEFKNTWRVLKKLQLPDKSQGFQCNNPIVKTTLFQVRKIVNSLLRELGKPKAIIIETTRDFNAGAEKRQQIIKRQKDNQTNREKAQNEIREYYGYDPAVHIPSIEVTKYLLWRNQNEYCPYSCKKIGMRDLLSRDTEVDHILPYSMSLDNSMGNKVVCFVKENQDKRQNTPLSWLGKDSKRFEEIQNNIENGVFGNDDRKWERFFVTNDEISEKYTPERLLRDTSYIATEVRSFLQKLYPVQSADQQVLTTKGTITAELRNVWDINAMLRDGEVGPKNREDLRHHAVDAAVIAVSRAGMIQKITKRLQEAWPKRPSKAGNIPQPWETFNSDLFAAVMQIKVSHRVQRKVRGKLHKETIFNKEINGPNQGKFITTVSLNGITAAQVGKICDERIKELVAERLEEFNGDSKKAFDKPLFLPANPDKAERGERKIEGDVPIKKVRIAENSSTKVQIDDHIWCEPGNNHHVEIFKAKVKGKETLIRRVYTLLEVSQKLAVMAGCDDIEKRKKAIISRENPFPDDPTITDVEFLMSLAIGESVLMKGKNGETVLARVGKISAGSESPTAIDINFLEHQLSRVEGSISDKTPNAYRFRSLSTFTQSEIKKVTVTPLGFIRWAND